MGFPPRPPPGVPPPPPPGMRPPLPPGFMAPPMGPLFGPRMLGPMPAGPQTVFEKGPEIKKIPEREEASGYVDNISKTSIEEYSRRSHKICPNGSENSQEPSQQTKIKTQDDAGHDRG